MARADNLRRFTNLVELFCMTSPCCVSELEQIVDGADHRPLGSDLVEAAQEELAEASGVFDLAEHRFDDLLSQAVAATPAGGLEFCRHGGLRRAPPPNLRSGRRPVAARAPPADVRPGALARA